jgi:hypothetical protein
MSDTDIKKLKRMCVLGVLTQKNGNAGAHILLSNTHTHTHTHTYTYIYRERESGREREWGRDEGLCSSPSLGKGILSVKIHRCVYEFRVTLQLVIRAHYIRYRVNCTHYQNYKSLLKTPLQNFFL